MDRAILTCIASFAFGIFVSSFVFISPLVSLFTFFVGVAIVVAERVWYGKLEAEVILITLTLISFSLGSFRYSVKDFHEEVLPLQTGIVVSEPEERDNATRFVMKSDNGERVLVSSGIYSPVKYGDRVVVEGEFEKPGMIGDFNYGAYLAKDDIYWTSSFAKVEVVSSGQGSLVRGTLIKIKKRFVEQIRENFSEPYASLLAGLIVAGRDAMPKDILEEFRRAGIIHIVVLSGYNITIIADFLRRFFEKLFLLSPRTAIPQLASGASILGIILFVLMTGAEATVVRAAIMVLTVIVAKMLGRKYSASRALLLAGFIMLLENPKILVFDPSFQLSFLATLALIYVVPIVEKYLKFISDKWELRTVIATTIGTQLTVLPLLVYSVGDISLVSLPTNILVLLIIPYTMLIGFIAVLISFLSTVIALPLAYITHLLLAWILGVSHFFGNMKFASIAIPHIPFWVPVLMYVALTIIVWRLRNSPQRNSS